MITISAEKFLGGKPAQVVEKAPVISEKQNGGFFSNVSKDIQQRGQNYYNQITSGENPVLSGIKGTAQLFGGIGDIAGEAAKNIAPKTTELVSGAIQSGMSKIINYSSPLGQKLLDFEQTHPTTAKILNGFLEIGAATGDIAGNILLAEGIPGSISKTGELLKTVSQKTFEKLPIEKTGNLLKTIGEKTTGLTMKMEEPTRIALQAYQAEQPTLFGRVKNFISGVENKEIGTSPITEANTAVRLLEPGTEWQLGVHAKKVSGSLWKNIIEPALGASKNINNMPSFLADLKNTIIKTTADLDRRKTLLKAWQSFADDYKPVRNFNDLKLQQYKEGWAKFIPEKTYKGEPIAAASKEVRNLAAEKARKILYDILPEGKMKQSYIDYGNLQSIEKAGIKSMDELRSKGITRQVWETILDKAVTPIATISGKILYKTGEGLEFIGNPGAKTVRNVINPIPLELIPGILNQNAQSTPVMPQSANSPKNQ